MAPGGGPPWSGRNVRGSYAGARVPSWMDQTGSFGSLTIMQLKCNGEGTSLPKDPFLIRRCLETYLNSKIEGGFPEQGGDTYGLKVRNTDHVAKLKNMTLLSDGISGGLRVNISIDEHPTLNFTKCTVFCTEVNHYEDERLLAELEDQNVTAIHRFTRMIDGVRTKTGLMVLTIRGCIIPEIVSFGFIRARTKIYYPSPMMCFRCFSFGHTSKRCKASDPVCGRCSEGHSCPKEDPCKKLAYCARCESADHALSSRKCPVYVAEETIQHIKTDNDISYQAARRIYEQENQQQNTNAATIVTQGVTNQLQQPTLDSVVRKLDQVLQDLSQKDAKIADLAAENGKLLDTITSLQKTIDKQNQMIQEMAAVGCKERTSTNYTSKDYAIENTTNTDPAAHQNRRSATGPATTAYPEPMDTLSRGVAERGLSEVSSTSPPSSCPSQEPSSLPTRRSTRLQHRAPPQPQALPIHRTYQREHGVPVPLAETSTNYTSKDYAIENSTNTDPAAHQNRRSATGPAVTAYPEPMDTLSRGVAERGLSEVSSTSPPSSCPSQEPSSQPTRRSTRLQHRAPSQPQTLPIHRTYQREHEVPVPLAGTSTNYTSKDYATENTTNTDPAAHQNRRSATGPAATAYPEPMDTLSRGVAERGLNEVSSTSPPSSCPSQEPSSQPTRRSTRLQHRAPSQPQALPIRRTYQREHGVPVPLAGTSTNYTSKDYAIENTTSTDPAAHQNRRSATGPAVTAYPEPMDTLSRGVAERGLSEVSSTSPPSSCPSQEQSSQPTRRSTRLQHRAPSQPQALPIHRTYQREHEVPVPLAGTSTNYTSKDYAIENTTSTDPAAHQNRRSATGPAATAYPEPMDTLSRGVAEYGLSEVSCTSPPSSCPSNSQEPSSRPARSILQNPPPLQYRNPPEAHANQSNLSNTSKDSSIATDPKDVLVFRKSFVGGKFSFCFARQRRCRCVRFARILGARKCL
ncbi:hypothetical protein quinque_008717 [Culex quinquefasciatus]